MKPRKKPVITLPARKGLFVNLSPEALAFVKDAAKATGMSQGHVVESAIRLLSSRQAQGQAKSENSKD